MHYCYAYDLGDMTSQVGDTYSVGSIYSFAWVEWLAVVAVEPFVGTYAGLPRRRPPFAGADVAGQLDGVAGVGAVAL